MHISSYGGKKVVGSKFEYYYDFFLGETHLITTYHLTRNICHQILYKKCFCRFLFNFTRNGDKTYQSNSIENKRKSKMKKFLNRRPISTLLLQENAWDHHIVGNRILRYMFFIRWYFAIRFVLFEEKGKIRIWDLAPFVTQRSLGCRVFVPPPPYSGSFQR